VPPVAPAVAYGNGGIRVVAPNGLNRRRLTSSDGDYQPSWSPTGRFLAFRSDRAEPGPAEGVMVIDVRSRAVRRLTRGYLAGFPAWSPVEQPVAFSGTVGTYVIAANGRGRRLVFENGEWPTWAPDGRALAVVSPQEGNKEIFVVDLETGAATNISRRGTEEEAPAWSPLGAQIAFVSDRDGIPELYVMQRDGSGVRRLTQSSSASEGFPVWTADGAIVFGRYRPGGVFAGAFLVAADGSGIRRLRGLERAGVRFPLALFRVRAAALR
jgi:Tol biopolymer transport system component